MASKLSFGDFGSCRLRYGVGFASVLGRFKNFSFSEGVPRSKGFTEGMSSRKFLDCEARCLEPGGNSIVCAGEWSLSKASTKH